MGENGETAAFSDREVRMGEVKKDCILYDKVKKTCRGLERLYCAREEKPCAFYKAESEYRPDGMPKDFWDRLSD